MPVDGRACLVLLAASAMAPSIAGAALTVTLCGGVDMPAIALGTYLGFDKNTLVRSENKTLRNAVLDAIDLGYRHFDTAAVYNTEEELGEAIRMKIGEGLVKREDIFVTTKLWNTHHERQQVHRAMNESLRRLGLDYVDLYLMHWPMGMNDDYTYSAVDFVDTYRGLEDVFLAGQARAIGVSNFNETQLRRVLKECAVPVSALQIEVHPQNVQSKLVSYAQSEGVVVMGYSPFGSLVVRNGAQLPGPKIDDPTLVKIAERHGKTTPQVVLRWLVERNIVPVVKSITPRRQEENINIFDFSLDKSELEQISKFDTQTRYTLPSFWQTHKYYPFVKIDRPLVDPFKNKDNK